jgi:hypothetical protein
MRATGVVFGLANPVGLAFWSGLGSSVVASGVIGWQQTSPRILYRSVQ